MNKKKYRRISLLAAFLLLAVNLFSTALPVFAAAGRITFTDPAANVGEAVSVTMQVAATDGSSVGSADIMLSYDPALLEFTGGEHANGGAGSIRIVGFASSESQSSLSFQLNFKALQAGSAVVSVTSQEVYTFNEELISMERLGNATVTINAPANFSTDANLASLAVSPGSLNPGFSPDVTTYTATVAEDAETIVIDAKQNDNAAKLAVSGNTNLKAGQVNKVTVRVTAEDNQTSKTYTINVTREGTAETTAPEETTEAESESESESETEPLPEGNAVVVVDGVSYAIAKSLEGIEIPEGYAAEEYLYQEIPVASAKNTEKDLRLLYLVNESGAGQFFIYNEVSHAFSPYRILSTSGLALTVLPFEEGVGMPDGYIEDEIQIQNEVLRAWIPENELNREFCLIYAMNENGEKSLYQYDIKEETIQRYVPLAKGMDAEDVFSSPDYLAQVDEYNVLIEEYNRQFYLSLALGGICLVLIIVIFNLIFLRNRDKKDREELEDEIEAEVDPPEEDVLPELYEEPEPLDTGGPPEYESEETSVPETETAVSEALPMLPESHEKEEQKTEVFTVEEQMEPEDLEEEEPDPIDIEGLSKLLNEMHQIYEPKEDKNDLMKEYQKLSSDDDDDDDDFEILDINDQN